MTLSTIDHVALPIRNVAAMLNFYQALGMRIDRTLAPSLYSAHLANQKINFHGPELWQDLRFSLRAPYARPGCGDLCFVWNGDIASIERHLNQMETSIIEGPVQREGGRGPAINLGTSVYVQDPDENLVELICYGCTD